MADSFASYWAVHKKGLTLNAKRVVDTLLSFYTVGDCAFDDDGHHGTPLQRERAAAWGAELAMASSPKSASCWPPRSPPASSSSCPSSSPPTPETPTTPIRQRIARGQDPRDRRRIGRGDPRVAA